jgi:hypothetical protein
MPLLPGNPFDREILNPLEKELSGDFNALQAQLDRNLREWIDGQLVSRTSVASDASMQPTAARCMGSAFKVRPTVGQLQVTVDPGLGFVSTPTDVPTAIGGITGLDDLSRMKPLVLASPATFPVPAPPGAGLFRVDTVQVKHGRVAGLATSREVFNATTRAFAPGTVNKLLTFALDSQTGQTVDPAVPTAPLSYRQGVTQALPVPFSGPTLPSVTPGYTAIAFVIVVSGDTNLDAGRVQDVRLLAHEASGNMHVELPLLAGANVGVPTLATLSAPPGMQVACVMRKSSVGVANAPLMTVFLLGAFPFQISGNDSNTNPILGTVGVTVTLGNAGGVDAGINLFNVSAPGFQYFGRVFGVISQPEKTDIEDATRTVTSPTGLKVALGAPRVAFQITPWTLTRATPPVFNRALNTDPVSFDPLPMVVGWRF